MRLVDLERRTLMYLAYSTRVVEGSPFNSLSTVPSCAGSHDRLLDPQEGTCDRTSFALSDALIGFRGLMLQRCPRIAMHF